MFCPTCQLLINDMVKTNFSEAHPNVEILKVNKPAVSNNICVLIEYVNFKKEYMFDHHTLKGVYNHCLNCGEKL